METKTIARVAAVHDMSGYGKCSLTVALPVISACGAEVCPVPTALLSTNTQIKGFTFTDCTGGMAAHIAHWKKIGLHLDAVYSGFLGSAEQIGYITDIARSFGVRFCIVDPVMGDNGKIYPTYTPELCDGMRRLVSCADVATPNLTEACELIGQDYACADQSSAGIERLARAVAALGAKNVVVTGIERGEKIFNCILEDGTYQEIYINLLPYRMHGTGDLFTSVMTGGLLTGHSLTDSVDSAARFVREAMKFSELVPDAHERGVCFEPLLYRLRGGVCA